MDGLFLTEQEVQNAVMVSSLAALKSSQYVFAVSAANSVATLPTSPDAGLFRTSVVGSFITVSAAVSSDDAGLFHVSALNQDANFMHVSGFSPDASLFRVSAINSISALSPDGGLFRVSAVNFPLTVSGTISAFINQGTVSAYSPDAGLFRVSGFTNTAASFPVSSTQGDASLLRASAFLSVVTTATGGASIFYSSAVSGQTSANVKTTAGRLYGYHIYNPAGVDQYLQIFNVSGLPAIGTDVPTLSLGIPTLGGAVMSLGDGIGFSTGIVITGTSTAAGNSIAASSMRVNIFYA